MPHLEHGLVCTSNVVAVTQSPAADRTSRIGLELREETQASWAATRLLVATLALTAAILCIGCLATKQLIAAEALAGILGTSKRVAFEIAVLGATRGCHGLAEPAVMAQSTSGPDRVNVAPDRAPTFGENDIRRRVRDDGVDCGPIGGRGSASLGDGGGGGRDRAGRTCNGLQAWLDDVLLTTVSSVVSRRG